MTFPIHPLNWRDYLPEPAVYHIRRYPIRDGGPVRTLFAHSHNFCEIFLLTGDGLWQNLNGTDVALPRGSLWRLHPGDWHGICCPDPARAEGELINLALRHETADYDWPRSGTERSIQLPEAGYQALLLAIAELEADVKRREAAATYFLRTAAYWWNRQSAARPAEAPDWLQQAMSRAERARQIPTPAEFARWCNRCPAHTGREMQRRYGRGVREYLTGLRLHAAARALAEGNKPLKEIAAAAGFAHISSFHRAFVREFQCTPQHYRNVRYRRLV